MEDIDQEKKKLTYEQLEQVLHQTRQQYEYVYNELQKVSLNNMFKRLDYLFKVLACKDSFSEEFVNKCSKEVEELMKLETEEKNGEEQN